MEKSPSRSTRTDVAVLLAEQRHGAGGHGCVIGHACVVSAGSVGADLLVDAALDALQLVRQ